MPEKIALMPRIRPDCHACNDEVYLLKDISPTHYLAYMCKECVLCEWCGALKSAGKHKDNCEQDEVNR